MAVLTIVIPCYNEQEILARIIRLINNGFHDVSYCLLLVDDGSSDRSWQIIRDSSKTMDELSAIRLARNFGHQQALLAGLHHCYSETVLILDADLQDPVEAARAMWDSWRLDPCDVIYGVRTERLGEPLWNRIAAGIYYRLMHILVGSAAMLDRGDFSLISLKIIEQIREYKAHNAYLRGYVHTLTDNKRHLYYTRKPRLGGETKYTLCKRFGLARNGFVLFSAGIARRTGLVAVLLAGICLLLFQLKIWMGFWFSLSLFASTAGLAIFALAAALWKRRAKSSIVQPYSIAETIGLKRRP